MFVKVDPPPLDPKEPWKGALGKPEQFAGPLCTLLKNTKQPTVVGLNAPYGFGKTFFLQRFVEQIKGDNGWVIYVNAWEYDYLDSPLFALLDAMKAAAAELGDKKEAKKIIGDIVKAAAPAVAKALSKKTMELAFGAEGTKEIIEAAGEGSKDVTDKLIRQFLDQDTTHKTLDTLRRRIGSFVESHIKPDSSYKSLIIIVDELDRARPDFSIRFLETIKHIFQMSQTIFLVGCDRAILQSSARHEFGQGLDADGYLRRLFDYWVDLPPPLGRNYVYECAHRLGLIKDGTFKENSRSYADDINLYADYLTLGVGENSVSLRFIEQSVAHAGIVLRLAQTDKQAALIGWLQNLKQSSFEQYQIYVSGNHRAAYDAIRHTPQWIAASDAQKTRLLLWTSRSGAPFGEGEARQIFSGNPDIDRIVDVVKRSDLDRESTAARIDRRMRTLSIYL